MRVFRCDQCSSESAGMGGWMELNGSLVPASNGTFINVGTYDDHWPLHICSWVCLGAWAASQQAQFESAKSR